MCEIKSVLQEKEKQLDELSLEYQSTKQVLLDNWKKTLQAAKKQYEAIDNALQVKNQPQFYKKIALYYRIRLCVWLYIFQRTFYLGFYPRFSGVF